MASQLHTKTITPQMVILVIIRGVAPGVIVVVDCGASGVGDSFVFEGEDTHRVTSCTTMSWDITVASRRSLCRPSSWTGSATDQR